MDSPGRPKRETIGAVREDDRERLTMLARAVRPAMSLRADGRRPLVDEPLVDFALHRHRVAPLLCAACHDRTMVDLSPATRARLEECHRDSLREHFRHKAAGARLARLFGRRDVRFVLLKGSNLWEQFDGVAPLRHAKDIDILVDPADSKAAIRAMNEAGYIYRPDSFTGRKIAPLARQNADMRILKDLTFIDPEHGVVIELHRRLFRLQPRGFARGLVRSVGEGTSPPISDPHYALYLVLHGSITCWHRLKWLVDLTLMLRSSAGPDARAVASLAREYGCMNAVIASLMLVRETFPASLPVKWADLVEHGGDCGEVGTLFERFRRTLHAEASVPARAPRRALFALDPPSQRVFPGRIGPIRSELSRLAVAATRRI